MYYIFKGLKYIEEYFVCPLNIINKTKDIIRNNHTLMNLTKS